MEDIELQVDRLLYEAGRVRENAYAPYSLFAVGAAVLTAAGRIFTGCNVENASFGLTVCAERIAIFKAITNGEERIAAVAIVAGGDLPAKPCGACLQVMSEFGGPDTIIVCATPEGRREDYRLSDLLPKPFEI